MRIDPHFFDPKQHPAAARRPFATPNAETFGGKPEFASLRGFTLRDNTIVNWREDLDLYTRRHRLGRIIWPVIYTAFASNFDELVAEVRDRGLFLFDLWGHVPGSNPEGMWAHVVPPAGMPQRLRETLGEQFLGFDNGEQDGRYVGGYAQQQCPSPADRFAQFLNFHRHFRRLGDDMGNQISALISLQCAHHFAREGNHMLIGAETGQALPNSQIYYAFIRGAGRQHGVGWFGSASVFNRWGYKSYEGEGESGGLRFGPEEGTSLSLLRRLMYTHIFYNCLFFGMENNWLLGDDNEKRLRGEPTRMQIDPSATALSPIGELQAAAVRWVERNGSPGVMITPTALLTDTFGGWAVPRHFYTSNIYQVWGAMPYDDGDHFLHGVFSMIYPGYEDTSYYRDERGYLTATPFGDAVDVLTADTRDETLQRYALVIAAGNIRATQELRDKLAAFITAGGQLILTAANRSILPDAVAIQEPTALRTASGPVHFADGTIIEESASFVLLSVIAPEWTVTAKAGDRLRCSKDDLSDAVGARPASPASVNRQSTGDAGVAPTTFEQSSDQPAVLQRSLGRGSITLLLCASGLDEGSISSIKNEVEQPLPPVKRLAKHVQHVIANTLHAVQPFEAGDGLGLIACRRSQGEYVLGIYNNTMQPQPVTIRSQLGPIQSITPLPLDRDAVDAQGYWPKGINASTAAPANHIAAGDFWALKVCINESSDIDLLPPATYAAAPRDRFISLRGHASVTETLLRWATFHEHFDGITIDWRYLRDRDPATLKHEADWLRRQRVRVMVDFASGLNFYPDLTLLDTFPPRYAESTAAIEDVLNKAALYASEAALISLHRPPENHCTPERAEERFRAGIEKLAQQAEALGMTLQLQNHPAKFFPTVGETSGFIRSLNCRSLRLAIQLGHDEQPLQASEIAQHADITGLILASSGTVDSLGQWYDTHGPARHAKADWQAIAQLNVPIVLDSTYPTWDAAYLDIKPVAAFIGKATS